MTRHQGTLTKSREIECVASLSRSQTNNINNKRNARGKKKLFHHKHINRETSNKIKWRDYGKWSFYQPSVKSLIINPPIKIVFVRNGSKTKPFAWLLFNVQN